MGFALLSDGFLRVNVEVLDHGLFKITSRSWHEGE
jgi:hypothetical protein